MQDMFNSFLLTRWNWFLFLLLMALVNAPHPQRFRALLSFYSFLHTGKIHSVGPSRHLWFKFLPNCNSISIWLTQCNKKWQEKMHNIFLKWNKMQMREEGCNFSVWNLINRQVHVASSLFAAVWQLSLKVNLNYNMELYFWQQPSWCVSVLATNSPDDTNIHLLRLRKTLCIWACHKTKANCREAFSFNAISEWLLLLALPLRPEQYEAKCLECVFVQFHEGFKKKRGYFCGPTRYARSTEKGLFCRSVSSFSHRSSLWGKLCFCHPSTSTKPTHSS